MLGVAIIGCGLIGRKRAAALPGGSLVACVDADPARAGSLAGQYAGARAASDWRNEITSPDIDVVIVATTNNMLAEIAVSAASAGKHVLVEKPGARNLRELESIVQAAGRTGSLVRVGFNHRYHPAYLKIVDLMKSEDVGQPMFVRGRYGHGGRLGYEKEWRANPAVSGGGELMDQGVHMIDLSRSLLGDFTSVDGFADTFYWDMPVDDNGFMLLRTEAGAAAFLHVSCSEWKNMFSLEVYCKRAKFQWDGIGGSYGAERLIYYRMKPEMGPPDAMSWDFDGGDASWSREFAEFAEDISLGRQPSAGLPDAKAAMIVVSRIYEKSGYSFSV
jgi:predicted dehydrogenase